MGYGKLYECPRILVESWWNIFEKRGLSVELQTPLTVNVNPEIDGVQYRGGTVRHEGAIIDIVACPGPFPPSTSQLCGKHFLVVNFRESSNADAKLAQIVGDLLLQLGASEVAPPLERKRVDKKGRM